MKIDKHYPIPGVVDAKSIVKKMKHGDSVLIKNNQQAECFRYQIRRCKGFKVVGRAEDKGYRIWKVKA